MYSPLAFTDGPNLEILSSEGSWSGTDLEVEEFAILVLTCDADANPEAESSSFKWFQNNVHIHSGATLQLNPVAREDHGDVYYCEATNIMYPSGENPVSETSQSPQITLWVLCKYIL